MNNDDFVLLRHKIHQAVKDELDHMVSNGLYVSEREEIEIMLGVWLSLTRSLRSIDRKRKAAEAAKVSTDTPT